MSEARILVEGNGKQEWIEVDDQDEEAIEALIWAALGDEEEEEPAYVVLGSEGELESLVCKGCTLGDVVVHTEGVIEYGDEWVEYFDDVGGASKESFEEARCGCFASEIKFAEQLVDDIYVLEGPLAMYFDYEAFARDLFIGDYFMTKSGYVFRNI